MANFIVFLTRFPGPSDPASHSSEQLGAKGGIFNQTKIILVEQILPTK